MTWLQRSPPFSSPTHHNGDDDDDDDHDNDDNHGNRSCLYGTGLVVNGRTEAVDVLDSEKEVRRRNGNHEQDVVDDGFIVSNTSTLSSPIPTPSSSPLRRPIPHSFFSNRLTVRRLIVRPCITFMVGAVLFHCFSVNPQMNAQKNVFQFEFSWGNDNNNESDLQQQQQQQKPPLLRSSKYVMLPSPYHTHNEMTLTKPKSPNSWSSTSTTSTPAVSTQEQFAYPTVPTSWYSGGSSSSGMTTTLKTNKDEMQVHSDEEDDDESSDDNDDSKENNDDDDDSPSLSDNTNNVAKFGWDPTLYPNPVYQPNQCGIAYLLDRYNNNNNNNNINNINSNGVDDEHANSTEDTTTPEASGSSIGTSHSPLRLCDPDWVLGGIYLEEIANAMQNFSRMFSTLSFPVPETSKGRNFFHPFRRGSSSRTTEDKDSTTTSKEEKQRDEELSSEDSTITASDEDDGSLSTTSRKNAPPFEFQVQEQQQQDEEEEPDDAERDTNVISTSPTTIRISEGNKQQRQHNEQATVELAIATVRSMNVPAVLRQGSYYTYEDEDDMVNDAAQLFARYLHNQWWSTDNNSDGDDPDGSKIDSLSRNNNNNHNYGILIFMSIQDRVCFISTGMAIRNILPWWRLEHVVASMKPDLRRRDYGHAILSAIDDLSAMIAAGPPTFQDRLHDFLTRFGVVIAFAIFTFVFGAYGEYSDRRKRWQYAESRSKLTPVELQKARLLQKGFHTSACPICLETFDYGEYDNEGQNIEIIEDTKPEQQHRFQSCLPTSSSSGHKQGEDSKQQTSATYNNNAGGGVSLGLGMKRVDSMGIPLWGYDKKRIKILRCGHMFCESCWKGYVHSGQGNPCICPVCRQDVGKSSKAKSSQQHQRRRRQQQQQQSQNDLDEQSRQQQQPPRDTTPLLFHTTTNNNTQRPSLGVSIISTRNSQPSYDSVAVSSSSSSRQGDNNVDGGEDALTSHTRDGGGGGGIWPAIRLFDRLRFGSDATATTGNVPFVTTATVRRTTNDGDYDDDDEYHDADLHHTDRMDDDDFSSEDEEDINNGGRDFGLDNDDEDDDESIEEEAPTEDHRLDPTPVEQITMWMAANPHAF